MCIESVMPSNHLILCHPFSFCPQSFPASESFPVSQIFAPGGQSIGASAAASYSGLISFRVDWFLLPTPQKVFWWLLAVTAQLSPLGFISFALTLCHLTLLRPSRPSGGREGAGHTLPAKPAITPLLLATGTLLPKGEGGLPGLLSRQETSRGWVQLPSQVTSYSHYIKLIHTLPQWTFYISSIKIPYTNMLLQLLEMAVWSPHLCSAQVWVAFIELASHLSHHLPEWAVTCERQKTTPFLPERGQKIPVLQVCAGG